uniref:Uncharacterized protein n=1 Tax=Arundo donax TaxID=35708 RepID=A0A0A8ZK74_ARUDO
MLRMHLIYALRNKAKPFLNNHQ